MAILSPSNLETIDYNSEFWQHIMNKNFWLLNDRLLKLWAMQDVKTPKARPRFSRIVRLNKPEDRNDASTWRVTFATLPRIGLRYERRIKLPPPPRREIMRTLARKLESLRRVIIAPESVVLKLARRYRRRFVHIGWRPPKRPPPTG